MKAIETRYKGYRFRSRLEARWAVFFDAIGWTWEYEVEGYAGEGFAYLPDFVVHIPLPGGKERRPVFVEIKRADLPPDEIRAATDRASALAVSQNQAVFILFGLPGSERMIAVSVDGKVHNLLALTPPVEVAAGIVGPAIRAARGARFEHGETPE